MNLANGIIAWVITGGGDVQGIQADSKLAGGILAFMSVQRDVRTIVELLTKVDSRL